MAAATVAGQHAAGADFIKVGFVAPDVFFAAQAEANRLGMGILGHLPVNIDVIRASREGMKSIEHLALIKKIAVNPTKLSRTADVELMQHAVDTFDQTKAEALAARFVADGTWQCPTLIRKRTSQLCDAPEYRHEENLRYVSDRLVKTWTASADAFAKRPAGERASFRDEFALCLRVTRLFDEAGVKMLAGSDASGAVWEVPGYALHQEFDLLAEAGLSPLRILQMTTLNGAEFLGTTATMGTVEVGKQADLVLLDANPVADVKHLHDVAGVVRAGRYYSAALGDIKRRVAAARSVR